MAKTITLRYPFNGDVYTAEGKFRIRVEHRGKWGYFDDCGRWLEGELKVADPTFCRFLSSSWMVEEDPEKWGVGKRSADAASNRSPTNENLKHSP